MKPVIDMNKSYGIVLEGGGARGAYQIGAWRALKEAGVRYHAVAGTSVGALNGALLCMGDLERAEEIWENMTYSRVISVKDDLMKGLFEGGAKPVEVLKEFFHMVSEGGADVTPLKQLIEDELDEEQIRKSGIDFYLLTFSISRMKELDLHIDDIEEGLLHDYLLASAYMFIFKHEPLHGKKYTDGAFINNYPLGSLTERGYKDIIAIRIFGPGREKKVKLTEDTTVHMIEPRVQLGNVVDFSTKKSRRNMKIGYYDAMRMIYGLKGFIYYIDHSAEECYYLKKLTELETDVRKYVCEIYGHGGAERLLTRTLLESVYPAIAQELKLAKNWSYEDLYIAILEAAAKLLRVPKYHIYCLEELEQKVIRRGRKRMATEKLPAFVYIILNTI